MSTHNIGFYEDLTNIIYIFTSYLAVFKLVNIEKSIMFFCNIQK